MAIRVVDGFCEFVGRAREIEAHIDDIGVVLYGVIHSAENVGEIAGAVSMEGFQWEDLCRRGHEVNDADYFSPMTKRDIGGTIHYGHGGLVHDCHTRLIRIPS